MKKREEKKTSGNTSDLNGESKEVFLERKKQKYWNRPPTTYGGVR